MNEFEEKDYAGARSYADAVRTNADHIMGIFNDIDGVMNIPNKVKTIGSRGDKHAEKRTETIVRRFVKDPLRHGTWGRTRHCGCEFPCGNVRTAADPSAWDRRCENRGSDPYAFPPGHLFRSRICHGSDRRRQSKA